MTKVCHFALGYSGEKSQLIYSSDLDHCLLNQSSFKKDFKEEIINNFVTRRQKHDRFAEHLGSYFCSGQGLQQYDTVYVFRLVESFTDVKNKARDGQLLTLQKLSAYSCARKSAVEFSKDRLITSLQIDHAGLLSSLKSQNFFEQKMLWYP